MRPRSRRILERRPQVHAQLEVPAERSVHLLLTKGSPDPSTHRVSPPRSGGRRRWASPSPCPSPCSGAQTCWRRAGRGHVAGLTRLPCALPPFLLPPFLLSSFPPAIINSPRSWQAGASGAFSTPRSCSGLETSAEAVKAADKGLRSRNKGGGSALSGDDSIFHFWSCLCLDEAPEPPSPSPSSSLAGRVLRSPPPCLRCAWHGPTQGLLAGDSLVPLGGLHRWNWAWAPLCTGIRPGALRASRMPSLLRPLQGLTPR